MPGNPDASEYFDIRHKGIIPAGRCVYVQSGDPSDFDGYFIGTAGAMLARCTEELDSVLVMPERRACADRKETDTNRHVPAFSEQVLNTAGRLFRRLCPTSIIVRGPLNTRNIIPLNFMFNEPEKYGPLLGVAGQNMEPIRWRSVSDLAALINEEIVTSVVLDMNGSVGYLDNLIKLCPQLGRKMKAAGVPITIMAGILAEAETTTLRVPGRDTRATMNAIYSAHAVHSLLDLASANGVPVLFVTNNTCNHMLRFQDAEEIVEQFQLSGLLKDLALVWYGPHLKGKCVPFDWVSFVAMVLHNRFPELLTLQTRQLFVGCDDPSVLVLRDPALEDTEVVNANMLGTKLWGEVECVMAVDKEAMLLLARYVSSQSTATGSQATASAAASGGVAPLSPRPAWPPQQQRGGLLAGALAGPRAQSQGGGGSMAVVAGGAASPSPGPMQRAASARLAVAPPAAPLAASGLGGGRC